MTINQMKTLDRVKAHFKAYKVHFIQTGVYIALKVLPYKIDELEALERITIDSLLDLNTIDTSKWSDYFYNWLDDIYSAVNNQIMKTGKRPDKVIFTCKEYTNLAYNNNTFDRVAMTGNPNVKESVLYLLSNFGIKEMIVLDVEYKR